MQGWYKSTVTCCNCQHASYKFDAVTCMPLPLPLKKPCLTDANLHQKAASSEPTTEAITPLRLEECLEVSHLSCVISALFSVPSLSCPVVLSLCSMHTFLLTPAFNPFLIPCTLPLLCTPARFRRWLGCLHHSLHPLGPCTACSPVSAPQRALTLTACSSWLKPSLSCHKPLSKLRSYQAPHCDHVQSQ